MLGMLELNSWFLVCRQPVSFSCFCVALAAILKKASQFWGFRENEKETGNYYIIQGYIRVILALYRDYGNYYSTMGL